MKNILTLIILISITHFTLAQCNSKKTKIMILGDSWAFFSSQFDSYNENLERFGFTDIDAATTSDISVNGTRASNYFSDLTRKNAVKEFIKTHHDLEFVHFSLGGNDFLGNWNNSMTTAEEDALFQTMMNDIKNGLDTVLSYNPKLKILFSGYDFPNFSETVGTLSSPVQELHPFYNLWDGMGQPTASEINALTIKATNLFVDSIAVWDKVYFVNNLGLMQWYHGQQTPLTVSPFGTYPKYTAPVPGGFPNYPSPTDALNFGGQDAFHLNNRSYERFIQRHFEEFYWKELRNADTTIIASDSLLNASILPNNIRFDSLEIGNKTSEKAKIILSFNTNNLKEENILNASIFIQRSKLKGTNLVDSNLNIEVKKGFFGTNLTIENEDYNNESDTNAIACIYGTLEANDYWLRIDLPKEIRKKINKEGITQFRLNFETTENDNFFSFKNKDIYLDIQYGEDTTDIEIIDKLEELDNNDMIIYPNPSNDFINIKTNKEILSIIIFNTKGQKIINSLNQNKIDIRNLKKGLYNISIITKNKNSVFEFIKK